VKRPTTVEEIEAHYERSVNVIREGAKAAGLEMGADSERVLRTMFYLGAEAFLSEVAKIRFLAPGDQSAQWKRLCDVCEKGVKP